MLIQVQDSVAWSESTIHGRCTAQRGACKRLWKFVRKRSAGAGGGATCDGTLYGTLCTQTCDVIRLHALE